MDCGKHMIGSQKTLNIIKIKFFQGMMKKLVEFY